MEVSGHKKVKTFKEEFKKEFGVGIRVYKWQHFADDEATLVSIRKGNSRKIANFDIISTAIVGNIEKYFLNKLGIKVHIEASNCALANNDYTLTKLKQQK